MELRYVYFDWKWLKEKMETHVAKVSFFSFTVYLVFLKEIAEKYRPARVQIVI